MTVYAKIGEVNYQQNPVPVNSRADWEFCACIKGRMEASLLGHDEDQIRRGRSFWVFPRRYAHGWCADAPCERVVFHLRIVPEELERLLPTRGYYWVPLTPADCGRLRQLASMAIEAGRYPTELLSLQDQALATELSLIALREVKPQPISNIQMALHKTGQALAWYAEHMAECPRFREDVAPAVHVSPSHLRRLFYQAMNESPHSAFNRLRMEKAHEFLQDSQSTLEVIAERVGFSSPSALSRAVKAYFGLSPVKLRSRSSYQLSSRPTLAGPRGTFVRP